jgi:hypothetical protein
MSWAGRNNAKITAQFQGGGSAKSGLGRHIGMNPFIYAAIVNGAAGHPAPAVTGTNWFSLYNTQYPVPATNQIGGVGMPRWGMTRAPADGVNTAAIDAGRARVRAGPPGWGLVFT